MGLLEIIRSYGKFMKLYGVKQPVFVLTPEAYDIFADPNSTLFKTCKYKAAHELDKELKAVPGAVGKYYGVLLVRRDICLKQ